MNEAKCSEKVLFFADPNGNPAGKTFVCGAQGRFILKAQYSAPKLLRPREVSVGNASGFFRAISDATKRGEFLVHGIKIANASLDADGLMRRLKLSRPGAEATCARSLVAVGLSTLT